MVGKGAVKLSTQFTQTALSARVEQGEGRGGRELGLTERCAAAISVMLLCSKSVDKVNMPPRPPTTTTTITITINLALSRPQKKEI
ncbi:hypothetical protein PAMP_002454 [Pampus punctatissimus]